MAVNIDIKEIRFVNIEDRQRSGAGVLLTNQVPGVEFVFSTRTPDLRVEGFEFNVKVRWEGDLNKAHGLAREEIKAFADGMKQAASRGT